MDRTKMFCPFMKEMCIEGWTKSMGEDADGQRPKCRCWVVLKGKDPQSDQMLDRGDCCLPWSNIIQVEQAQLLRSQLINDEMLRNELAKKPQE